MLIGLSDDPPEILTKSPYKEGLLYFARNEPLEKVRNDGSSRSRKTPMDPEVFHWEQIIGSMFGRSLDRAPFDCFQVDVDSFQVIKDGYQKLLSSTTGD